MRDLWLYLTSTDHIVVSSTELCAMVNAADCAIGAKRRNAKLIAEYEALRTAFLG